MVLAFAVVLISSVNTPQARFFVAERFQLRIHRALV